MSGDGGAAKQNGEAAPKRSLLPSIEAALSSGQTLKDIKTTLLGALKQQALTRKGLIKAFDKSAPRIVGVPRLDMHGTYGKQTRRKLSDYILTQQADKAVRYRQLPPEADGYRPVAGGINERSEVGNYYACFGRARIECGTRRHDAPHKIRRGEENCGARRRRDRTHLVHGCRIPC